MKMNSNDEINEKNTIIENLKEYLLILEFNNSKKDEQISALNNRISQLENENVNLKKENEHFKSTKAYKVWQKYRRD